jgi:predicted membrane protein
MPFAIVLAVIFVGLVVLLLYRNYGLTSHEDDTVHIHDGEEGFITVQEVLARKVAVTDRWAKILTVVLVTGAVILGVIHSYRAFTSAM